MEIKYENISALRIDLNDCEQIPSEILKPFRPSCFKNYAWIPQTLGDQIWVLYEFETKDEREKWERSLPSEILKWLDRKLIKHAISYGWHIRNMNGFICESRT